MPANLISEWCVIVQNTFGREENKICMFFETLIPMKCIHAAAPGGEKHGRKVFRLQKAEVQSNMIIDPELIIGIQIEDATIHSVKKRFSA